MKFYFWLSTPLEIIYKAETNILAVARVPQRVTKTPHSHYISPTEFLKVPSSLCCCDYILFTTCNVKIFCGLIT